MRAPQTVKHLTIPHFLADPQSKSLCLTTPLLQKKRQAICARKTEKKEKKGDFALRAVAAAARRRAAARVVGGALAGVLDALPVASMLHGAAATRPAVVRRIVIGRAPVAQSASHALHLRPLARRLARLARSFKVLFDLFLPSHPAEQKMQVWQKKKIWAGFSLPGLDSTLDIEFWPVNFQFLYKMGTVRKSVMVLTCSSPRTSKIEELAESADFRKFAFAHSTAYLSQKQERKAMQIFDS